MTTMIMPVKQQRQRQNDITDRLYGVRAKPYIMSLCMVKMRTENDLERERNSSNSLFTHCVRRSIALLHIYHHSVSRFFNNYNSIGSLSFLLFSLHYCQPLKSIFFGVFLVHNFFFIVCFFFFFFVRLFVCILGMRLERVTKSICRESYKFLCPYLHLQKYIFRSLSVRQSVSQRKI